MTAIFLSDVHLRDADSVKTQLVLRFLQEEASKYEKIYLLGDLFDVWPGTNAFLIGRFRPVIDVLKELVSEGHEVHYVEGNHDFRLGNYFSDSLGIKVHPGEHVETWGEQRVYMAHGDLGNPRQLGYRVLRHLLRNNLVHAIARLVPPQAVFQFGMKSSQLSRDYQGRSPVVEDTIRQIYRENAERLFRRGNDVVIMGHTHIPDDHRVLVDGRHCRYLNTGDWVRHFTYLVFDDQQFYTKTHPVKQQTLT